MDDQEMDDQEAAPQVISSRAFSEEVEIPDPRDGDASLAENLNAISRLAEVRWTDLSVVEDLWSQVKTHVEENADELSEYLAEKIIETLATEYEHQARTASASGEWERFEESVLFGFPEPDEPVEGNPHPNALRRDGLTPRPHSGPPDGPARSAGPVRGHHGAFHQ